MVVEVAIEARLDDFGLLLSGISSMSAAWRCFLPIGNIESPDRLSSVTERVFIIVSNSPKRGLRSRRRRGSAAAVGRSLWTFFSQDMSHTSELLASGGVEWSGATDVVASLVGFMASKVSFLRRLFCIRMAEFGVLYTP